MAENNIMVDLETLATTTDSVILTIGAVKFDPFANYLAGNVALTDLDTYYARIDLDTQDGRVVDDSTVEWWSKQNKAAQDEAFAVDGRIHLDQALAELHQFIWGSKLTWCQGLTFDLPILEHAYRQYKRDTPWRFWETRCSRSLCDLVHVNMPDNLAVATHDAREDCYKQIINTQLVLEKLEITKFVR